MKSNHRDRTALASGDKRPLVAPLLVLLFLAVSGIGFGLQRRAVAQDEQYRADKDTYQVLAIRTEMAWLHLDLLISGLEAELTGTEPSADELATFNQTRSEAISELTEIAGRESLAGDIAEELLITYNESTEAYQSDWPYPAAALDNDHYISADPNIAPPPTAEERQIEDGLILSLLPRLILIDGLALALDDRPEPVSEWAQGYVRFSADVARNTPGWLGPDRTDPLSNNALISTGLSVPASSLTAYTELQRIWDYDQWLLGFATEDPMGPAPLTLAELREAEVPTSAALANLVRQQIEQGRGEPQSAWPVSEGQLLLVAILSGVASVVVAVVLVVRRRHQHKHLADAVFTDSLTGMKNRRYLSTELQERCRRRNTHHVVAMIDLDRFKMVNDTWGHDVGDAILVAAAERLAAVVEAVTSPWAQAEGSVVRLGGDEFVVVLHSPDRFHLGALEAGFRATAGPVDVGIEVPVTLELSVGLAESFEPIDIHELLKGADLAVYRDKRGDRGSASTPTSEPSSDATSTSATVGPPPVSVDLR